MKKDVIKRFGCKTLLHSGPRYNSEPVLVHYWSGFDLPSFNRWHWYFQYRAALLKVANPKRYVELFDFSYEYMSTFDQQRKRMKDKLASKRAKLTQCRNAFNDLRENWSLLFPIEEDPRYQVTVDKIGELAGAVACQEREYEAFISPATR